MFREFSVALRQSTLQVESPLKGDGRGGLGGGGCGGGCEFSGAGGGNGGGAFAGGDGGTGGDKRFLCWEGLYGGGGGG